MPQRSTTPDENGAVNGGRDGQVCGPPGRNGTPAVPYDGLRVCQKKPEYLARERRSTDNAERIGGPEGGRGGLPLRRAGDRREPNRALPLFEVAARHQDQTVGFTGVEADGEIGRGERTGPADKDQVSAARLVFPGAVRLDRNTSTNHLGREPDIGGIRQCKCAL